MRGPYVTLALKIGLDEPQRRAIAFEDGTVEERTDPESGEITERPKWFWIPRSQIKSMEETRHEGLVEVEMTEWIATKAGLV